MNYVKHSDGTITYYDNQGRPVRGDLSRQSTDYYIKSDGTRINGPFDFAEPKTASMINGNPISLSQDFVKHSDGTVEKYPRGYQWPTVSGLGDPQRPNGVYMEPSPSSEVPATPALSDEDIVRGILRNEYGTGDERKNKLLNLGLSLDDIERIRGLVNARMYAAQARPAKRRQSTSVPVSTTPRQERTTYQGMPMNWVGPQDPEYIYVR